MQKIAGEILKDSPELRLKTLGLDPNQFEVVNE
jgi:hypothetical protein